MRKTFLCVVLIINGVISIAQSDTSLISLEERLNEYMTINKQLDFEKLFDYIHPKIYEIAPRKDMVEAFRKIYDNPELSLGIDSIRKKKISESFQFNGGTYRLVDYHMVMWMKFKDEARVEDSSFVQTMLSGLKEGFAGKEVSFNKEKKTFVISGGDKLIAIKDTSKSPWMFLGYQKGNAQIANLLPAEVIQHFKLNDN